MGFFYQNELLVISKTSEQSEEQSVYDHMEDDDLAVSAGKDSMAMVPSDPAHNNSTRSKKVKSPRSSLHSSVETKTRAVTRAEEFLHNFGTEFPAFIKPLLKSHVSGGWMMLCKKFCQLHLPKKDLLLTLEDENGKEFEIIYIFQRTALSGGLKNFAVAHKLLEDDVLIFQLVKPLEPIRLKVYIIRANEDGAIDPHSPVKAKTHAMAQAEKFCYNSGTKFPTFTKPLLKSHVSGSMMRICKEFCKLHLPRKDLLLTLEDENGKEFEVKYIFQRTSLGRGWNNFAVAHKLLEDDVLIFQLVKPLEPIRLKVYIIRANGDGAIGLHSPIKAKTHAVTQAEELRYNLGTKFPTFIKPLFKSHVSGGYWMGLPALFCKSHLPEKDMEITLETETWEQFQTKYLADRQGLSAGWITFAKTQNLAEGDVAIFQLVESNKFKVYIVKAKDLNEESGALSLVNVNARGQQKDTEKGAAAKNCQISLAFNITKRKRSKTPQISMVQRNKKKYLGKSVPKTLQLTNLCKANDDKGNDLEVIASPSQVQFKDVQSFKDFTIVVDELCIDSELPDDIRAKYYTLCSDKKSFLHDGLMQGLHSKLVAGIICEIVIISDSLKICSLTTCRDEYANWDKALKMFKFLGMRVGFLRTRIRELMETCEKYDDDVKGSQIPCENL